MADGIAPIAFSVEVDVNAAFTVTADRATGCVMLALAAEPGARLLLPPDNALDLSLRLIASVNQLRRPPAGGGR